jgi:Bax protein
MIKKNFSLGEIKKYLKYKGLTIIKKNKKNNTFIKNSNIGSIPRTILSSVIIISFFLITPFIINFKNEREIFSKEFENNSKDNFKKTLEGKNTDRTTKVDEELNIKDLFEDIFEFDELPSDVVRLNASTIEQLFKDTNYNLNDVREKKLVKPVSLSLLPKEMKMIENIKKRKELFIQIILPLVIDENNKIRIDRNKLFHVLNKRNNSKSEKRWLQEKFKLYGVKNRDLSTLKIRMDEIPTSLAIAQAAKETGWGTSRFALEGNALFGQWTWTGEGIKPAGADNEI